MACTDTIVKNITSDCTTQPNGAIEAKAWILPRADFANAITFDTTIPSKITNIAPVATKRAYVLKGIKKLLNVGHDLVAADDRADKYTHYFSFQQFEVAAEDIANVDALNDVIIITERLDKQTGGNGTFIAHGVKNGLFKSSDSRRSNDINGARSIELTSMGGSEENFSEYTVLNTSYPLTLAMLEALETVGL